MRRFRFTISSLLGLMLFLAVGFAALREATELWDGAVFSTTLGVLSASVLLSIHRADHRRAFWLGFALFGWISLGDSLIPPIESRLLTTKALILLDSKMPGRDATGTLTVKLVPSGNMSNDSQVLAFSSDGSSLSSGRPATIRLWNTATGKPLGGSGGTTESFLRIGHSIVALVLAYLGGHLSRWLSDRGRRVIGGGVPSTHSVPGVSVE